MRAVASSSGKGGAKGAGFMKNQRVLVFQKPLPL